jgi:hypothetical protein
MIPLGIGSAGTKTTSTATTKAPVTSQIQARLVSAGWAHARSRRAPVPVAKNAAATSR